jgi:hypothetical protein
MKTGAFDHARLPKPAFERAGEASLRDCAATGNVPYCSDIAVTEMMPGERAAIATYE